MKVYIELIFIDNFLINLLILLLAARLAATKIRWGRHILAAAVGGIYGCMAVVIDWIGFLPFKAVVAIAMCFAAFWAPKESRFLKSTCAFWAVSFILAGAAYASAISFGEPSMAGGVIMIKPCGRYILTGISAGAVLTSILSRIRKNVRLKESCSVTLRLRYEGKTYCAKTFVDTGNLVKEMFSGCHVIFLNRSAAVKLLGKQILSLTAGKGDISTERLRIVPCVTAAGKQIFYGIEIDEVELLEAKGNVRAVVCMAKHALPSGFEAIAGSGLVDALKKGKENEDDVGSEIICMDNVKVGSAGGDRLYKRQRSFAAASVFAGRDGVVAAFAGRGQVGKADPD